MRLLCTSFLSSFLRILIFHTVFLTLFDFSHRNCVNGASVSSDLDLDSASDLDLDLKSMIKNLNLKTQQNLFYPLVKDSRIKVKVDGGEKEGKNIRSSGILYPTASTTSGDFRGSVHLSRNGRPYSSFEGIQYGNSERFQPSTLSTEIWEGIRDALTPGPPCMQLSGSKVIGSEDCHYLNVHKSHEDYCQGKIPVIFYIHGGSFLTGDGSSYSPKYFMSECVIFVTFNYRLGALGFLSTEDETITGNFGLYDCITALQWVKQNIGGFGGDPDKVTIMGLSAGSSMVSHLVASEMAAGLFHRAISQSGVVLNPWSVAKNSKETAISLAQKCECPVETTQEMADCLRGKSGEEIVQNQSEFIDLDMMTMTVKVLPLAPVVQSWETKTRGFQTEDPREKYKKGEVNKVPFMAGFTRDEGISMVGGEILSNSLYQMLLNGQWSTFGPAVLMLEGQGYSPQQLSDITAAVWDFYLGDNKIGEETREQFINLCSDRGFNMGIFETLDFHSQVAPAYGYTLRYRGGRSSAERYGYETPQCSHGDDVPMVCPISGFEDEGLNDEYQRAGSEQRAFSEDLVQIFTTFADTGRPEGAVPAWPKIEPANNKVNEFWYELNRPNRVAYDCLDDRFTFWKDLFTKNQPMS